LVGGGRFGVFLFVSVVFRPKKTAHPGQRRRKPSKKDGEGVGKGSQKGGGGKIDHGKKINPRRQPKGGDQRKMKPDLKGKKPRSGIRGRSSKENRAVRKPSGDPGWKKTVKEKNKKRRTKKKNWKVALGGKNNIVKGKKHPKIVRPDFRC